MSEQADIVERLRLREAYTVYNYSEVIEQLEKDCLEAADLIETLRCGNERIEKLREAADMEIAALRARLEATE